MSKEKKEMEEAIVDIVDKLSSSVIQESREENADEIERIKEFMKKSAHLKLEENPEYFNLFICHQTDMVINTVLSDIVPDGKNKIPIIFLYKNYSFLSNHLTHYIDEKVGRSCCSDRSRYILNGFKEYLETGKKLDMSGDDYFVCPFGSSEQWIEFVKALCSSFNRFPNEKEKKIFEEMDKAAAKYVERREIEEAAYQLRLKNTRIDFRMIQDMKMAILIENKEDGGIFATMLDIFMNNSDEPHKNMYNFLLSSATYPQVFTITGGDLNICNKADWTGSLNSFNSIARMEGLNKT